jgi:hypothetical protein
MTTDRANDRAAQFLERLHNEAASDPDSDTSDWFEPSIAVAELKIIESLDYGEPKRRAAEAALLVRTALHTSIKQGQQLARQARLAEEYAAARARESAELATKLNRATVALAVATMLLVIVTGLSIFVR